MKILAQIIACLLFGTVLGMAFWMCDGGKACPKVSEAQGMAFKVYQGQWKEDIIKVDDYWSSSYLEVEK